MLIISADDFGKNELATNRTILCFEKRSISSTSAMVFMKDSERASDLAKEHGIDAGLHLNFTQQFSERPGDFRLCEYHEQILGFLTKSKYSCVVYNPFLKKQFEYVFQAQLEEFQRLYGHSPSHIDGHHHMHLCSNMLFGGIIPDGQKIRRNFAHDRGEKNLLKRAYRKCMDDRLRKKYQTTDYLFSLPEVLNFQKTEKIYELAKTSVVELETHPEVEKDFIWLNENAPFLSCSQIDVGNYSRLNSMKKR